MMTQLSQQSVRQRFISCSASHIHLPRHTSACPRFSTACPITHLPVTSHIPLISVFWVCRSGCPAQGGFHGSFAGLPVCDQHHTSHWLLVYPLVRSIPLLLWVFTRKSILPLQGLSPPWCLRTICRHAFLVFSSVGLSFVLSIFLVFLSGFLRREVFTVVMLAFPCVINMTQRLNMTDILSAHAYPWRVEQHEVSVLLRHSG